MFDTIILGGGTVRGLEEQAAASKALVEIDGKAMIEYLIDAFRNASLINRIVALVPLSAQHEKWTSRIDKILVASDSMIENIRAGLEYLSSESDLSSHVVLSSCDIPLLTAEAIEDFLRRCQQHEAEIYYTIISREVINKVYPETKRTYATLKDGTFTGGNIGLVSPEAIMNNFSLLEKAYNLRKSPLQLARVLGFKFIVKFAMYSLTIAEAEERVSDMLNAQGKAVITPYPEIGIDVDKQVDLELVRRVLKEKKRTKAQGQHKRKEET